MKPILPQQKKSITMEKKNATQILHSENNVPAQPPFNLRHGYLLKGKVLQPLTQELLGSKPPAERKFKLVREIEQLLLQFA